MSQVKIKYMLKEANQFFFYKALPLALGFWGFFFFPVGITGSLLKPLKMDQSDINFLLEAYRNERAFSFQGTELLCQFCILVTINTLIYTQNVHLYNFLQH